MIASSFNQYITNRTENGAVKVITPLDFNIEIEKSSFCLCFVAWAHKYSFTED